MKKIELRTIEIDEKDGQFIAYKFELLGTKKQELRISIPKDKDFKEDLKDIWLDEESSKKLIEFLNMNYIK